MENNLMTVFTRIFHTQGDSLVELSAWIENVRNGQWKNEVENYRRLMAEGKKQEAASVKEQLPALVPAGNCQVSHQPHRLCHVRHGQDAARRAPERFCPAEGSSLGGSLSCHCLRNRPPHLRLHRCGTSRCLPPGL